MKKLLSILTFLIVSTSLFAQYNPTRKGKFYAFWGWNRDAYTKSNIHLKGADYNITLHRAKAHDKPIPPNYHDYLQLNRVTIPQTNVRLGYFIQNNLAISIGLDHMKYVMTQDQTVQVTGVITRPGNYAKNYDNDVKLTDDFLTFEHTDGLNYINFNIEKYKQLYHAKNNSVIVHGCFFGGTGILVPKTNVKFLDYERNDRFHLSGFGLSAGAALQAIFFKRILLRLETKGGYINMPNIILHKKGIDGRGKQAFFFAEALLGLGASFSF